MSKSFKSVVIQGARSKDRAHLASIARHVLMREPAGSVADVIDQLLETGRVIEAHFVKERNGSFMFRVEESPKINEVLVEGNEQVAVGAIRGVLQSQENKLLNAKTMAADASRIAELYLRCGHPKPGVTVNRAFEGKKTASLTFVIREHDRSLDVDGKPATRFRRRKKKWPPSKRKDLDPVKPTNTTDYEIASPDESGDANLLANQHSMQGGVKGQNATGGASGDLREEISAYAASWTGRFGIEDQIRIIRAVAPRAMGELSTLIEIVEARRFNDDETQQALDLLRALHHDLGLLIDAVENAKIKSLIVRIARKNDKLKRLIGLGAKVGLVAPALTVGISHMISGITQVPIDSTMVSTVFATMVVMPLVEDHILASARNDKRLTIDNWRMS